MKNKLMLMLGFVLLVLVSSGSVSADLTDNLISYWKLDETSPGDVIDAYGNNDGTNHGADINQPGKIGTAYEFIAANNDYIDLGTDNSLNPSEFTVSFWVKDISSYGTIFTTSKKDATRYNFLITSYTAPVRIRFQLFTGIGTTNFNFNSDTIESPAIFNFVVCTYDGTTAKMYVNNILQDGTRLGTMGIGVDYGAEIGRSYIGSTSDPNHFDGTLDEIGYWSREITEEERTELWNDGDGFDYLSILIPTIIASATTPDPALPDQDWQINITATDDDNETFTAWTQFYVNSIISGSEISFGISNNTNTLIATLAHANFNDGDLLTAEVWVGDGETNSTRVNITIIVGINHPPNQPTLNSPADNTVVYNDQVTLNITVTDDDGDVMNVSFYSSSISGIEYKQNADLGINTMVFFTSVNRGFRIYINKTCYLVSATKYGLDQTTHIELAHDNGTEINRTAVVGNVATFDNVKLTAGNYYRILGYHAGNVNLYYTSWDGPYINEYISFVSPCESLDWGCQTPEQDNRPYTILFLDVTLIIIIGNTTNIANGSYATYDWTNLANGNYEWYTTITDGTNTITSPFYSFIIYDYNYTVNHTSPVLETSSQTFTLNITRDPLYIEDGNATLHWNGTAYPMNATVYDTYLWFSKTLTIPSVSANTNITLNWSYEFWNPADNSKETNRTGDFIQTILNVEIGLCGGIYKHLLVNFSYFDEINNERINLTNSYNLIIFDGIRYFNQASSFVNTENDSFCTTLDPSLLVYNWNMWGTLTLSKSSYITRVIDINPSFPYVISNDPLTNLSFFLIGVANSSTVVYNWFTYEYQLIDGTMRIYQCNDDGSKSMIESIPIISGVATANIELLIQPYSYDVIINGLLYEDNTGFTKCHTESSTEITYFIDVGIIDLAPLIGLDSVPCSLYKASNTTVTMVWGANPEEEGYVSGCIIGYRRTLRGNVEVYNNCSIEADGYTRTVAIPMNNNEYVVVGKLKQGDNIVICGEEVTFRAEDYSAGVFSITGLIATFFLIAAMALIFSKSGEYQLVGVGIGVIASFGLGIINLPWGIISSIILFLVLIIVIGRTDKK